MQWIALLFGGFIASLILYGAFIWWTRVRPKTPRLDRDWTADCAQTPRVQIQDGVAHFSNVRDFKWRTTRDRDEAWIEQSVTVDDLLHVWFIIVHFDVVSSLAHTMLSFEFKDGTILTASFEARREKGKRYNPWLGLWRTYELYLAWGTERDLIGVRTNAREDRVHMFRVVARPEKERAIFIDLCRRTESLAKQAEWYHSLRTTCMTTIVKHINLITPGRIPFTWRSVLPGHSAKAALRLGLIEDWGGIEKTIALSRIDQVAKEYSEGENFSELIRARLPEID